MEVHVSAVGVQPPSSVSHHSGGGSDAKFGHAAEYRMPNGVTLLANGAQGSRTPQQAS
jgi:hypothetical protein